MKQRSDWIKIIKKFIPKDAVLLENQCPYIKSLVQFEDFDKDGVPEISSLYEWRGNKYLIIIKKSQGKWLCAYNYFIGASLDNEPCLRLKELYPASVNTVRGAKWGYINSQGKFIISPSFENAYDFQDNGLAVVTAGNKTGLINERGNWVVKPQYESISKFSEGIAAAFDSTGAKAINEKGDVVFAAQFIGDFKEGRARFVPQNSQGQWIYGYFDSQGKIVIPAKYAYAGDFNNQKAVVKLDEKTYAIIDESGKILSKLNYAVVGELSEGLMSFQNNNQNKFGYIDEKGDVVIKPKFSDAQKFQDGRAIVNASEDFLNKYGLIDRNGNYTAAPAYNNILMLGEGRAAYGKAINPNNSFMNSIYAVGDLDGKLLTDFIYYDVRPFKNGLASANDGKYTFFINKTGKKAPGLISVKGIGDLSIMNDIIQANVDFRISYYNASGNLIYETNTRIPLDDKYIVIEEKYRPNRNYITYYPQVKGIDNKASEFDVNNKLRTMAQAEGISSTAELEYSYSGDFTIKFFNKELLVLEMSGYNYPFGAAHGMPNLIYAHVDMRRGVFYGLKDLFKQNSNYVQVLSDIIKKQIDEQGENSMIWPDAYKGIKADQPFYVNQEALHIYFTPYEIAPYAAGFPTFIIPFVQVMSIIDIKGEFWRSFH